MPPRKVLDDDIVLIRVRAADFDSVVGRRNDPHFDFLTSRSSD